MEELSIFYSMTARTLLCIIATLIISSCKNENKPVVQQAGDIQIIDSTKTESPAPSEPEGQPQTVEDIQKAYTAVMAKMQEGKLDSTSFTYSCENEAEGTVTYYSEGGRLRIIVHEYSEQDHHGAEDRYFIKDSSLFFTYFNTTFWSFDGGGEGSTKDDITEHRIYVVNQKPIKCLEKKYSIRSKATNNPKAEDVANKDVNCPAIKPVLATYQLLLKYRNKGTTGCLE